MDFWNDIVTEKGFWAMLLLKAHDISIESLPVRLSETFFRRVACILRWGLLFFKLNGNRIASGTHKNETQKHGRQTGRPQRQGLITDTMIVKKIKAKNNEQNQTGDSKKIADQQTDRSQRYQKQKGQSYK